MPAIIDNIFVYRQDVTPQATAPPSWKRLLTPLDAQTLNPDSIHRIIKQLGVGPGRVFPTVTDPLQPVEGATVTKQIN